MKMTCSATQRRGVAMLLVLISLLMATILTAGYLASRDNSAAIGENVVAAAEARWTAAAGMEIGIAILQTESDWRTSHVAGKLIDDYVLATGSFDLDLIDAETGDVPDEHTDVVDLTATATVDGVSQISTARVAISGGGTTETVDLDFSEFVVFSNDIEIKDDAMIGRWLTAPSTPLGGQMAVGTQSTGMGSITLDAGTAPIDMVVFHGPGASGSLVVNDTDQTIATVGLLDQLPMPAPPATPGMPGAYVGTFIADNADILMPQSMTVNDFFINNGIVQSQDQQTLYVRQQSVLVDGGSMLIHGDTTLVFTKPLILSDASIELQPGARLTIYANGGIDMSEAYIGPLRADPSVRDNSGKAPYVNPETVTIYGGGAWRLQHNSVVQGALYAPGADLRIDDDSAVYGSVVAQSLELTQNGAIFYDGALNDRLGFTNLKSAVYQSDGHIRPEILAMTSLDDTLLDLVAGALGAIVKVLGGLFGSPGSPPSPGPSDPTPRPVLVNVDLLSFGDRTGAWETNYYDSYTAPLPTITDPKVINLVTQ